MSDFRSIADAVRAAELRDPPNLRHYAPHPCAPTQEEIAREAYGDRTLDEIESDLFGKPATGPL